MHRLAPLAFVAAALAALAGCGGSAKPRVLPAGVAEHTRDVGGGWSVVWGSVGTKAYAVALDRGRKAASASIRLRPLGPTPGGAAASIPQVAAEIRAPAAIDDSTLLVDGTPISTSGGGPTPSYQTMYGAPAAALAKGRHVVVAFARAGAAGRAVAWTFTVR